MAKPTCHAGRDGECFWSRCPQLVTYQDACPLDNTCPECGAGEDAPTCSTCNGSGFVLRTDSAKDDGQK